MNGFTKALMGMIHVSMNGTIAKSLSSGTTTLALAAIVLLVAAGGASAAAPITNCAELQDMKNDLSGDYYLANDINCSGFEYGDGKGCMPIGGWYCGFTGTFDGRGYKITNLYINRPSTDYVGLFGGTELGCEIKNVCLEDVNVSGNDNVGGLVGWNYRGIVSNCYSTGSVSGRYIVGGLVGHNYGGTINNSYSTGSVYGSGCVGGLAGENEWGKINNSYFTGSVNGSGCAGGLAGFSYAGKIKNSYWDIYRSGQSICVGREEHGAITNCTGKNAGNSEPDYWYYISNAPMDNWDFDNIWAIEEGESYPYLQTEEEQGGCVCDDGWCDNVGRAYYQCGDTVTESCTFNGSMICTDTTRPGLEVGASDITIGGSGHKIAGNRTASFCYGWEDTPDTHSGMFIHNMNNVIIKNLEVKQFCTGISIWSSSNVTVDTCHIHHNGKEGEGSSTHGIHLVKTTNCKIITNTIHDTIGGDYDACYGGGNGIYVFHCIGDPGNHLISNNTLYNNAKAGFFTKAGMSYSTITHNTARDNGCTPSGGGIIGRCKQTNHNHIAHNNCSDNTGDGLFIGGHYNTIEHNIAKNNTYDGIYMGRCDGGSTNNELYNNTVCGNGNKDICVCYPDGGENHGDCNTCNTTSNYDDDGTTGCTYNCPGETDLNITAKYEQWFGEVYNVIYTIKNIGHSTAGDSTTGISIDGTLNKTDPVGLIGPGESYIRTVGPFTMSGSEDTINVTADYEHVISETNETNNCMENVFTGVVMPDLVITDKSEAWVDLVNKTYNVTYTVKNIGNTDAGASDVGIYIDGVFNRTVSTKALAPEEEETKTVGPFTMSDESDTIRICADNESAVEESNEDNNCQQNTFEHPGVPDLVITRKYEEWVASNDTWRNYTVTYTVKNIGTGDAGASTTSIIIDGEEVATDIVGALGDGDSYTNTLGPYTMPDPDESDTIKVCADKDNVVEESNEDNNCLENVFDYSGIGCLADDNTLFRCGNTVTRNCTFNGDMSCPFTHGLELGANSITINGNNSVLDGTGCTLDAMSRSGIYNKGYDDVTIEHLEVKGFCHGLYLYGTGAEGNVYRNTIEHCDIHHNGNASTTAGLFGITMKYVYNSTIRNNTVHHQIAGVDPNPGCEDGGNGMFLYKGCYNNITENRVYNNTKGGIFIKMQPMHNNISHNDLWDNGQGGIILRCMMSNYNTIEHNNASNNYGSGMFIGARENTIRYNTVCDNRGGGPYYQDSVGGHGYGIHLGRGDGSFDNYLHDNEICGNDYKDIYVVSGVTGNHGENNTCDTTDNYDDTGTTGCTYSCGGGGICGDVDGLPGVTTNDGRQIFMYLLHGAEAYPLADTWAADCDGLCDGITTNDGRQIFMHLLHGPDAYPLNCSC